VHMYADKVTASMARAIDETNRRRDKQIAYNVEHGIDPTPLRKKIGDITDLLAREDADTVALLADAKVTTRTRSLAGSDLVELIQDLTQQMHLAASELQFELAARYRDEVGELKKELRGMQEAGQA
jgi:excinuclease ABC subunit B